MYKKALFFSLFTILSTFIFASFPVNKANVEKSNAQVETMEILTVESTTAVEMPNITLDEASALSPAAASDSGDRTVILLLLWFFLGVFAAHRWYARKPTGWNILFILTGGGLGIWWIVDLINILTDNFD